MVTALIKEIEIYRNDESEYPLKRIGLNFPVFKDGGEVTELLWDKGNTVETDYLLTYSDENRFTASQEADFLQRKTDSANNVEIIAVVDDVVAGTAGIDALGMRDKIKHRAVFGIAITKEFWELGIGKYLMEACIECAREAGYLQLELEVVAENERAVEMYKRAGFIEYGRNPKAFRLRTGEYQELIDMRLELK